MQILIQEIWGEPLASGELPGDASAAGHGDLVNRVVGHKMKLGPLSEPTPLACDSSVSF